MQTQKRNLMMSMSIVLISVLSISIGATAIRSTPNAKVKSASNVIPISECATHLVGIKKYNGEWVPVIQLPEVNIEASALKKSK